MYTIDHHVVASVSIVGTFLDVLGTLYLAYDLLGGETGPLRLLTRAVTYSMVFGIGYGLGLGVLFGITAGLTTGVTIAIELHRAARRGDHYPLLWEAFFATIRGVGFAVGLHRLVACDSRRCSGCWSASGQCLRTGAVCGQGWIIAQRRGRGFLANNFGGRCCARLAMPQQHSCAEFSRNV